MEAAASMAEEAEEVTDENDARTTRPSRSKELEMMYALKCGFEKPRLRRSTAAALAVSALLAAGSVKPCLAGPSSQTSFPSPDEASRALVSTVQEHDERALMKILGGGSGLIRSGDTPEDALEREHFVQKYTRKCTGGFARPAESLHYTSAQRTGLSLFLSRHATVCGNSIRRPEPMRSSSGGSARMK